MPRKKPFSNKQKKKQLTQKRQRKKDHGEETTRGHRKSSSSDADQHQERSEDEEQETVGLHHQPVNSVERARDPNRFVLKFGKDSKSELDERRKQAFEPIIKVSEDELEKSIESVYQPGSVLDMPKRPSWNYKWSKQKVERNEEEMFEQYKNKILSEYKSADLSYFECNLETWRQLWRVLEVSDIVVIVADVRFPILHFSPALYDHVVNDLNKHVILLLNKIDLVNPEIVVAWKYYFKSNYHNVDIICFTSFPKDEEERKMLHEKVLKRVRQKKRQNFAVGARELMEACSRICHDRVDLSEWEKKISIQCKDFEELQADFEELTDSEDSEDDSAGHSQHEDVACNESLLTLGLVGHPNVGKSSLLNGLVGKKVVSTSRTPGHTKHFQTIFLTSNVRLCDSPGLVFPSLIDKQLQILSGLYPISQVQEPYTSVGYLATRWPIIELLHLVHPIDNENLNAEKKRQTIGRSDHQWSAMDVCDAWAEQRGFLTAKAGRNDTYRAANSILRLAVEGKIPFFFYPPGFLANKGKWLNHPDTNMISELQENHSVHQRNKVKNVSESESDDDGFNSDSATNVNMVSSNPFALLADES